MSVIPIQPKENAGARQSRAYLRSFSELYERVSGTGLVPPQAIEIEESLLGAMMIDKVAANRALEVLGDRTLEDSPFYREAHTAIYRAMVDLDSKGEPIDVLSVTNRLRLNGALEEVGGPSYLVELTSKVVTTANVEAHSRLLLEKYLGRELIRTCEEVKLRAFLGEDDTFELLDQAEGNLFRLSETRHRRSFQRMDRLSHETMEHLQHVHDHHSSVTGVPTGLTDLDEITAGWQKTDLIIIAARPSQGKTALALTLARNAALNPIKEHRIPVAIFSLEMGAQQLVLRLLCSEAQVDMQSARKGKLSGEDWKKVSLGISRLHEAPIFIDDTAAITPLELRAKCRRLKATENIGLVIVDYLQLMEVSRSMDSREREISTISRSLKALSKELNIPVIALSQLNRGVESRTDKRPMLSDLRESGAIEQDADLVLFIYRPETYGIEQYDDGKQTEGTAEIIIGKHRNGPIGQARVSFRGNIGSFNNLIYIPEFDDAPQKPSNNSPAF
ncbi:MAG TPA: replicative DNA helicase [Candidatus Kapabacteria bacterium]|nr:replicative DNA helicase [Candidatus Kapabacteria bacterium]